MTTESTAGRTRPADRDRAPTSPGGRRRAHAFPAAFPRAASLACAALALASAAMDARAIDLGEPSVQSRQGQRLKIALPYGSAPGETVSAARFSVASASAPDGRGAPDPAGFTISKPDRRNVVFLQSREPVDAARVKLVIEVAGTPPARLEVDVAVPASR